MVARVRGITRLIDRGYSLDKQIKQLSGELEEIKCKIRQHAEAIDNHILKGYTAKVNVADSKRSVIRPSDAYKALNSKTNFFLCVNVVKNRLSSFLSNDEIEKFTETTTEKFYTVRFYSICDDDHGELDKRPLRKMDINGKNGE